MVGVTLWCSLCTVMIITLVHYPLYRIKVEFREWKWNPSHCSNTHDTNINRHFNIESTSQTTLRTHIKPYIPLSSTGYNGTQLTH